IATIDRVSGKSWRVAEILTAMLAIPARPVSAADPGDTYARANRKLRVRSVHNFAHYLMSRNDSFAQQRQFAFDNVQIGAANATSAHPQEKMGWLGFRPRHLGNPKRMLRNILRRSKDVGF